MDLCKALSASTTVQDRHSSWSGTLIRRRTGATSWECSSERKVVLLQTPRRRRILPRARA